MSTPRKSRLLPIFTTIFIDLVGVGIVIPVLAPLFLSATSPLAPPEWTFATRTLVIGLLSAVYPVFQFFGAPYLGALSDRWGRKPVLMMSLVGTFIGYLFFALAIGWGKVWLLFISRALDGFTGGNISTAQSAISDVSTPETRAGNFGVTGMAFGLGLILGPYIGGKLADPTVVYWFTAATPFWFAAGLTFLNILLVAFRFQETLRQRLSSPLSLLSGFRNLGRAWRLPKLRTIFVVIFLFTFGFNFYTQFFQVLLIQKFNFTPAAIGELFAYAGICFALSQGLVTPRVSRYWRPEQILPYALLLLGFTLGIMMLPKVAWVLYLITPVMALGIGLTQPNATAVVSNLADAQSQGEVLGINQSITSLAMAIPPIISGIVVAHSLYLPIVLSATFVLLAWLVFVTLFKRQHHALFREV